MKQSPKHERTPCLTLHPPLQPFENGDPKGSPTFSLEIKFHFSPFNFLFSIDWIFESAIFHFFVLLVFLKLALNLDLGDFSFTMLN